MEHSDKQHLLAQTLEDIDARINLLEDDIRRDNVEKDFSQLLERASRIAGELMIAYARHADKLIPDTDDLLKVFRAFVKGDPSLNAVRDNVRELVYYRNCLEMGKSEALPVRPAHMAVRTVRHMYLYLYTRCSQEQRLP